MSLYEAITHLRGVLEQDVFLPADAEELAKRRENIVSDDDVDRLSDDILEIARDEANDIYRQLEKQYDYLMSDEGIAEELKGSEREFDVDPDTGELMEAKDIFKPASKKEVAKREADAKAARIKSGKVYFDDLNDVDKETVIQKTRDDSDYPSYEWWDGDIGHKWRGRDGKYHETRGYYDEQLEKKGFEDTEIHFSGFYSQGDGACFSCHLDVPKIVKHYKIEVRPPVQKAIDYGLFSGRITTSGRYSHANTMEIDLEFEGYNESRRVNEQDDVFTPASQEEYAKRLKKSNHIRINDEQVVSLIDYSELTDEEKKELDYTTEGSFFRYNGEIFDLGEFLRTVGELKVLGWDGVAGMTYDSGYVVKDIEGDSLVAAYMYYSSSNESVNEQEDVFRPATPEEVVSRQPEGYKSLNDVYPAGDTEIWYWKSTGTEQEHGQEVDFMMGYNWCVKKGCLPDPNNLEKTHILLGTVDLGKKGLNHTYNMMQGEQWSPNGEARKMIISKGLHHTSMSVGDIIKIGDKVMMVDTLGFNDLNNPKDVLEASGEQEEHDVFKPASAEELATRPGWAEAEQDRIRHQEEYEVRRRRIEQRHATRPDSRALIRQWVSGSRRKGGAASLTVKGDVLFSYATPIAIRGDDGIIHIVDQKFSRTTSKQQSYVRGAAGEGGYDVIPVRQFKQMLDQKGTDYGYSWLREDVFKPASKEELAARQAEWIKSVQKKVTDEGATIEYLDPPQANRLDSFWYDGPVAKVTYTAANGEERLLQVGAYGEIRVTFVDSDEDYRDGRAVEEADRRGYTDADLQDVAWGDTGGKVAVWDNNNWFELMYGSSRWEGLEDIMGDTFGTYDEAVEAAVDIITDDEAWRDLTDRLIPESKVNEEDVFKPASRKELKQREEDRKKTAAQAIEKARAEGKEVTFGPGKYWLGDICYVMRDDIYDDFWGREHNYAEGVFDFEGVKFAVDRTAFGDGAYRGSDGKTYGVDAGVIGIVPDELADEDKLVRATYSRGLNVKKELKFLSVDGTFIITADGENITINTGDDTMDEARSRGRRCPKCGSSMHHDTDDEGTSTYKCARCGYDMARPMAELDDLYEAEKEVFKPASAKEVAKRRENAPRIYHVFDFDDLSNRTDRWFDGPNAYEKAEYYAKKLVQDGYDRVRIVEEDDVEDEDTDGETVWFGGDDELGDYTREEANADLKAGLKGIDEAEEDVFKPAGEEELKARGTYQYLPKSGSFEYKFLRRIAAADPEDSTWQIVGMGNYVDYESSEIYFHRDGSIEFNINYDAQLVVPDNMELSDSLTAERQAFEGNDAEWLAFKGWKVEYTGYTGNEDPYYLWTNEDFGYTSFSAEQDEHVLGGAIIEFRGEEPQVYLGDLDDVINALHQSDPPQDIADMFDYDHYENLIYDIKKYRGKLTAEEEQEERQPETSHGQINWTFENPQGTFTEAKVNEEEEDVFKPATREEMTARTAEYTRIALEQKKKRSDALKAYYAAIPYTYEEIKKLPWYKKIVALEGVTDITTHLQKSHKTTAFEYRYLLVHGKAGDIQMADAKQVPFYVYANGYLRSASYGDTYMINKFEPAETLSAYDEILGELYLVIRRRIRKEKRKQQLNKEKENRNGNG